MEPVVAEGAIGARLRLSAMRASLAHVADVRLGAVVSLAVLDRDDHAADA